jgi:uncharacterized protein YdeI (YjbR/CyaY-like superfamily)
VARLDPTDITYFETPEQLRAWFAEHHRDRDQLWLGLRKVGSGAASVTWPQAVDEALCVGWIDGITKRIDDTAYTIRFTPRKRGSIWSAVNVARVAALTAEGRMQPDGLAAFAARRADNTAVYAYEVTAEDLPAEMEARIQAVPAAAAYWAKQTRSYRRTATHWVLSAKQDATRERRLQSLIESCADARPIPPMRYGSGAGT